MILRFTDNEQASVFLRMQPKIFSQRNVREKCEGESVGCK